MFVDENDAYNARDTMKMDDDKEDDVSQDCDVFEDND